jgi:hypothetical protein
VVFVVGDVPATTAASRLLTGRRFSTAAPRGQKQSWPPAAHDIFVQQLGLAWRSRIRSYGMILMAQLAPKASVKLCFVAHWVCVVAMLSLRKGKIFDLFNYFKWITEKR